MHTQLRRWLFCFKTRRVRAALLVARQAGATQYCGKITSSQYGLRPKVSTSLLQTLARAPSITGGLRLEFEPFGGQRNLRMSLSEAPP